MDVERARAYLLSLPHVVETQQWGDNLVMWVGDKAIHGKMFALIDLGSGMSKGVVSFAAGPERFAELLERDGLIPAPYLARAYWIAAERWDALRNAEWEELFAAAQALTYAKLPEKVRTSLHLPVKQLGALVAEGRAAHACKPGPKKKSVRKTARAPRKAKPAV
jgi:predicted DNA-binding protein (MmcQ/YjbR family)